MKFLSIFCFVVDTEVEADKRVVLSRLVTLRRKLAEQGVDAENCPPGQYSGLICPTVFLLLICLYICQDLSTMWMLLSVMFALSFGIHVEYLEKG